MTSDAEINRIDIAVHPHHEDRLVTVIFTFIPGNRYEWSRIPLSKLECLLAGKEVPGCRTSGRN